MLKIKFIYITPHTSLLEDYRSTLTDMFKNLKCKFKFFGHHLEISDSNEVEIFEEFNSRKGENKIEALKKALGNNFIEKIANYIYENQSNSKEKTIILIEKDLTKTPQKESKDSYETICSYGDKLYTEIQNLDKTKRLFLLLTTELFNYPQNEDIKYIVCETRSTKNGLILEDRYYDDVPNSWLNIIKSNKELEIILSYAENAIDIKATYLVEILVRFLIKDFDML